MDGDSRRAQRKREHIHWALALDEGPVAVGFQDVVLLHNCLPELALREVSLQTALAGRSLEAPIIINAMTGGAPEAGPINAALARVAREKGLAMAVGSQTAGLLDEGLADTYRVVRDENPQGLVIANVGAPTPPEAAARAVAMVKADMLQVHLNAPQEMVMAEGDKDFRGWLAGIAAIAAHVSVPVIAKEVGFGMAWEEAVKLAEAGAAAVDVGGQGGTNFIDIEARRQGEEAPDDLRHWGIPTACSLAEVVFFLNDRLEVVASGGIRSGFDAAKALALGAVAVGIARPFLKALAQEGEEGLRRRIDQLLSELRLALALTGSRDLAQLRQRPVVVLGLTARWLERRGVDLEALARGGVAAWRGPHERAAT